ncbi:MAG: aminodeoxychorismate lyase [Sideroxydans sp.]|nr:aminodeoxychorismate lyase [Sideroxydans sp.]
MLVNGLPSGLVNAEDRGLFYGDGVFRTLRVRQGAPVSWLHHYSRLYRDCDALRIACPAADLLFAELQSLCASQQDCVAKIIITRGVGSRGYAPAAGGNATRIISISATPQYDPLYFSSGIALHVCQLKLGHQPLLAGIKHLNRLENVLAARECQEAGLPEGLLEDERGFVISGTRSNLFFLRGGTLYTPDLSQCGVAGVQRERVIAWADKHGLPCIIKKISMDELLNADEIFMVNSVFGLWPVRELASYQRNSHSVAWKVQEWLNDEN